MIPYPLKDECLASYIGRLIRLSGTKYFIDREILFISRPEYFSPFLRRLGRMNKFLQKHNIDICAYNDLSLPRFLEPFLNRKQIKDIRKYLKNSDLQTKNNYSRASREVFKEQLAICPECYSYDITNYGFSYLRKHHQIRVLPICCKHETLLISNCNECNEPLVIEGIPNTQCVNCKTENPPTIASEKFSKITISAFNNIALSIDEIFHGKINGNLNTGLLFNSRHKSRRAKAINSMCLSNEIRNVYSLKWLSKINLNPYRQPSYGWPSIYVNQSWGASNPSMELLLSGLDCFNEKNNIWRPDKRNTYPILWHAGLIQLHGKIIKDLLRGVLPEQIAKSENTHKRHIHGVLHAYPDLERRYWIARKQITSTRHKNQILQFVKLNPNCTKYDIRTELIGANSYTYQNDRTWWENHVGYRSSYGPANKNGRRPRLRRQNTKQLKSLSN